MPWTFVSLQESAILNSPLVPEKDFLAVFFSLDSETPEIQRHIANLFPGAGIIGYRNSGKYPPGALTKNEDDLLVVQVPMTSNLGRQSLKVWQQSGGMNSMVQRRADEIQDFFEAFVNTVNPPQISQTTSWHEPAYQQNPVI
jgi:hypothetical protein